MPKLLDISNDEWKELAPRLEHYAVGKMRWLRWRGCRPALGVTGPGGFDAGDLVATAIERVFGEVRKWCESTDPHAQLCSVIDSLVSHHADSRANRCERSMPTTQTDDGKECLVEHPGREPDPSTALTASEDLEETNRFRDAVRAAIAGDPLVGEIFECLLAGFAKPSEMAEAIGVGVEQIYTAKKRLRRAVEGVTGKTSKTSKAKR